MSGRSDVQREMYGWELLKRMGALLLLFLLFVITAAGACAEENGISPEENTAEAGTGAAGMPVLCAEDEMVVIGVIENDSFHYYAYDTDGNRIGFIPVSDWGADAKIIKKSCLLLQGGDELTVFHAGSMKGIASYPEERYMVFARGNLYFTLEKDTGLVTLYDNTAAALGSTYIKERIPSDVWFDGSIFSFEKEWLLHFEAYEQDIWVWISKKDGTGREEDSQSLLELLNNDDLAFHTMGEYLVFVPYSRSADKISGLVTTKEGLKLMDNISGFAGEIPRGLYDVYDPWAPPTGEMQIVCRKNGDVYDLYGGASLAYLGSTKELPCDEDCHDGFIKGLSSPALLDHPVDGFARDCEDGDYCPYAMLENETLLVRDGELLHFPAGEHPALLTSVYYVTENEGTRVYRMDDGRLFAEFYESPERCVSLGSSGIALNDEPEEEDGYARTRTLYDNEGNAVYHSGNTSLKAFNHGTWFMTRGIYLGLTDVSGSWILKDTMEKE